MAHSLEITTKFRRTLASFTAKLTKDEADDFNFATLDDLKKAVDDMQIQQGSERRMQNLGRLSAFLEAMEQYDKVVQIFLNAADLLAFIWGPAKFMLLTASTCVEAFNNLLDAYEEIGEHLPLLNQYEDLMKEQPHLQHILGLIYEDILTFHQKAMRHFRNRMWKILFHATWKTFRTDFQPVLNHLQSHKELLHRQAVLIGIQQTQEVMRHIQQAREEDKAKTVQKQEDEEKRRRREVYSWLGAADSAGDQETATEIRSKHLTTGHWILQHDLVNSWSKPISPCEPCIWINGKPGAGKTILASVLIEKCGQIPHANTAFFYCRSEDVNRNTFVGVCRGILLQLAQQEASITSHIYEKSSSSGRNQLDSAGLAKELLDVTLKAFESLFIVIDGIDECRKKEKDLVASWFQSMTTNHPALLRCCFISQDDKDTGKLFRNLPSFKITEEHNGGDIADYCADMEIKIADSFGIGPSELHSLKIAETVALKADGMFLFAKLVMENLSQQCSRADLEIEIESIPPDLDKAYDRLLIRIFKESPVPEQKIARKLLCWLLCSQRPLKWREIQGAMSFDPQTCTFDYKRSLTGDSKRFCGSLVEVRKGGTIELVHQTARKYLEKQDELQLPTEDLRFTCLCLGYLTLQSHDESLPEDVLRHFIEDGCYAFSDYATVYWRNHLEITATGRTLERDNCLETLNHSIRSFCNRRVTAISIRAKPNAKERETFSQFKEQDFYAALAHATEQRRGHRSSKAKSDEEFSLIPQLLKVRKTMELLISEAKAPQKERLHFFYGSNIFKCSEVRCHFFHEGFSTSRERDAHQNKHRRAFICTFPGCPASSIGFITESELKRHEINYHQGVVDDDTFPWRGAASSIEITKEIPRGNVVAVEAWLDQWEGDVPWESLWNPRASKSKSPLKIAITCGSPEILETLLQRSPIEIFRASQFLKEVKGNDSNNVFKEVLNTYNDEVVSIFMSRAIEIEPSSLETAIKLEFDKVASLLLDRASTGGDSSFHIRSPSYLAVAVQNDRTDLVRHLVLDLQVSIGQDRITLHKAMRGAFQKSQLDIIRYLVQDDQTDTLLRREMIGAFQGFQSDGFKNLLGDEHNGFTPREVMISVVQKQQLEMFQFLLKYGQIDMWATDNAAKSLISELAIRGHVDFLRDMLPMPDASKRINAALLLSFCHYGNVDGVKKILGEGDVYLNSHDAYGRTPLHHAVAMRHLKIVEVLVEDPGIDLEAQMSDESSALHQAISMGRLDIVQTLLDAAIRPDELSRGIFVAGVETTALQMTELSETSHNIRDLLTEYLACLTAWDLYPVDSTSLLRFCATGSLSMVRSAYRRAPKTLDTPDNRGVTPFLQAIKCGRQEIAQFLVDVGCTVDVFEGTDLYSPLMFAVMDGDLKIVRFLLWEARVDPAYQNGVGQTALSFLDSGRGNANQIRGDIEDALYMASVC